LDGNPRKKQWREICSKVAAAAEKEHPDDPDNILRLVLLGQTQGWNGQHTEAAATYKKALLFANKIATEDPDTASAVVKNRAAAVNLLLAKELMLSGKPEEAEQLYRNVLRQDLKSPLYNDVGNEGLFDALCRQKKFDIAESLLQSSKTSSSGNNNENFAANFPKFYDRAIIYHQEGKNELALAVYQYIFAHKDKLDKKQYAICQRDYSRVLRDTGKLDDAFDAYEQANSLCPQVWRARL